MQSLRFAEFGPPSVLRIEEVPIPEPVEGEALVRVKAAAMNPSDIANVSGRFKNTTLPRTPGRDFAGIVVKGKLYEGEEVWGSAPKLGIVRDGSHAEYVVVPAETLSPKPKSLSMAQAAAIGFPYITAWACVVNAAQIQAGETILVVGAADAVGQAATQITNWKKAWVIGADITSDPIPGTGSVINTQSEDLRERVFELMAEKGVNAVFDTVGGPVRAGTAAFTPELLNFLKNTAMMGGLLFIAATESQPTLLPRSARSNVREWTRNEGPTPSTARAS
jgi:NADPH:quinone reductase